MALANQEAQRRSHEYLGTEHIFLALLKEGSGTGVHALLGLGPTSASSRLRLRRPCCVGHRLANLE
jgi:ATP-dependent Clp protease ATP-binding subunit ClpA